MQDDSSTVNDYQASGTVSEDHQSITTTFELESDLNVQFEGSTYASSADIEMLQARLAELEEQEAAGLETEEASNVLRARLELAKAKAAFEREEQRKAEMNRQAGSSSQQNQTLAASRILQPTQRGNLLANWLQYGSSFCAVAGGVLLSSNTSVSKYGFIFLACSSSQIFMSSMLLKQKSLMIYGASLFILVDCVGIYRWILTGAS